jgi:hypothetical protein
MDTELQNQENMPTSFNNPMYESFPQAAEPKSPAVSVVSFSSSLPSTPSPRDIHPPSLPSPAPPSNGTAHDSAPSPPRAKKVVSFSPTSLETDRDTAALVEADESDV